MQRRRALEQRRCFLWNYRTSAILAEMVVHHCSHCRNPGYRGRGSLFHFNSTIAKATCTDAAEEDKNQPAEIESHAKQISQTARDTSRALDEIVWAANPQNDTLEGLVNYACKYAQDYLALAGLRYRLEVPPQLPATVIPPDLRHNIFLAFKESVNNVVKHARANEVKIRLRLNGDTFTMEVEDDGRGPAEAATKQGRNGLRNMRKRMEDVGGEFILEPGEGRGTRVRLTAPLKKR